MTVDLRKINLYNKWLYRHHVYAEGDSQFHKQLTKQVVENYVDPLNLSKTAKILDLGCGPGYFLDEMQQRGYEDITGVTLSQEDVELCESKGHLVRAHDLSFLPESSDTVDFVFLRHALEHSPYPIFSLMEYNRVLKIRARLYIEVPQPDCDRQHEFNPNHYSILGNTMLVALLERTGFVIEQFNGFDFQLVDGEHLVTEKYYCVVAQKTESLDIN
jgi:SAM-dependent methyltransferase